MRPILANRARTARSEWLIKRCGNPESKSSVRGGKRKGHVPYSLTLECIHHWKGGKYLVVACECGVRRPSKLFPPDGESLEQSFFISQCPNCPETWGSHNVLGWIRYNNICSIDSPNNSPNMVMSQQKLACQNIEICFCGGCFEMFILELSQACSLL